MRNGKKIAGFVAARDEEVKTKKGKKGGASQQGKGRAHQREKEEGCIFTDRWEEPGLRGVDKRRVKSRATEKKRKKRKLRPKGLEGGVEKLASKRSALEETNSGN